jgi:predicted DNA-binding protein with PD1-like motif
MESQGTRYGYAVRIEPGEEIIATLAEFAGRVGVRAGEISGIGAGADFELGFFVPATREYVRRTFPGDYEITSLMGNLSELEGRPYPHCHVVIGGQDFVAWTGHLFRGVVTITCEVQIVTDPGVIRRISRPDLGVNPISLGG